MVVIMCPIDSLDILNLENERQKTFEQWPGTFLVLKKWPLPTFIIMLIVFLLNRNGKRRKEYNLMIDHDKWLPSCRLSKKQYNRKNVI